MMPSRKWQNDRVVSFLDIFLKALELVVCFMLCRRSRHFVLGHFPLLTRTKETLWRMSHFACLSGHHYDLGDYFAWTTAHGLQRKDNTHWQGQFVLVLVCGTGHIRHALRPKIAKSGLIITRQSFKKIPNPLGAKDNQKSPIILQNQLVCKVAGFFVSQLSLSSLKTTNIFLWGKFPSTIRERTPSFGSCFLRPLSVKHIININVTLSLLHPQWSLTFLRSTVPWLEPSHLLNRPC